MRGMINVRKNGKREDGERRNKAQWHSGSVSVL